MVELEMWMIILLFFGGKGGCVIYYDEDAFSVGNRSLRLGRWRIDLTWGWKMGRSCAWFVEWCF